MFEHLKDKSFNDLFDIDKKILNLAELITTGSILKNFRTCECSTFSMSSNFSSENHKKRTKLSKIAFISIVYWLSTY